MRNHSIYLLIFKGEIMVDGVNDGLHVGRKKVTQEIVDPDRKIAKVITGSIVVKKKSWIDRFSETFFGNDAKGIGEYIVWDVLVPAAKNTIEDMVTTGIKMLLFGESKSSISSRDRVRSHVSYDTKFRGDRPSYRRDRDERPERNRARHNFDDIIIERRSEADEVLSTLIAAIDEYGTVSVADFYDAVGISTTWADTNFGWDNLSRATVEPTRHGWYLNLPRPLSLSD